MSVSNHEYLGNYVVSLAAFKAMPLEEDTMGDSIGFVFKLDAPELVVLKLPQKVANALAQEIGKMVENLPDTAFDALQHKAMADWSLTSLQLKLIKIGASVVRHARAITFQLAEVAVTGPMVRAVLAAIRRLRTPPSCA